jgi:hypothetical protein
MNELKEAMTRDQKIEIIDEILNDKNPDGLCEQFAIKLYEKVIADCMEYRGMSDYNIIMKYIPEFALVKPKNRNVNKFWFGKPIERNIPRRAKALRRLREIILEHD